MEGRKGTLKAGRRMDGGTRLRKTAVPVEISQYRFCVFVCACHFVISSIPGKSFHFPFLLFVIFVLQYFPFHVVCLKY